MLLNNAGVRHRFTSRMQQTFFSQERTSCANRRIILGAYAFRLTEAFPEFFSCQPYGNQMDVLVWLSWFAELYM